MGESLVFPICCISFCEMAVSKSKLPLNDQLKALRTFAKLEK